MDQLVSRLLLYGDLGEESILGKLAGYFSGVEGQRNAPAGFGPGHL